MEIHNGLSEYELIDIDKELEQVHCFPSVMDGLKASRKEMTFDPFEMFIFYERRQRVSMNHIFTKKSQCNQN